ncbi:hypothetical protein [Nocardia sp. NPDC059229]|uniref:hypothetical protein n=1 Tax=Nocardia sp. NPDC059229 TaxID=3346778 RepID=UPI0036A27C8C
MILALKGIDLGRVIETGRRQWLPGICALLDCGLDLFDVLNGDPVRPRVGMTTGLVDASREP